MASIYDWSTTADSNNSSDSGINWSEGQNSKTVNNSARAMMGRIAEFLADISGTLTAGGTADALTVTANSSFTTYANGRMISFIAASDNTGAATLNVNSVGAKAIRKRGSTGDTALAAGDIQSGAVYTVIYNTSLNGAAGAWLLVNDPIPALLNTIAGLAVTDGNFIVGNGTTWVAESGATVRASLGLASSTTDNALVRFDSTAGATQNSGITVDDSNNMTMPSGATITFAA